MDNTKQIPKENVNTSQIGTMQDPNIQMLNTIIPVEIEFDNKEDILVELYTKGSVSYNIKLPKGFEIQIKTLTMEEIELFQALLSKATTKQSNFLSETSFNLLYSKWWYTFIVEKIKLSETQIISIENTKQDLCEKYKQLQLEVLTPDQYNEKMDILYREAYEIQDKIFKDISTYLFSLISAYYTKLNEITPNFM